MNRLLVIVLAALLLSSACSSDHNESSEYCFIDETGWAYGDTLTFHPELADSVVEGAVTLSLRHSNDYLFSNLWLEVTTTDSLGQRIDTLNITLADRLGRWQGRGIGTDFQNTDTLFQRLRLRRPVTFSVRHIMRVERLMDVDRVGIAIIQ